MLYNLGWYEDVLLSGKSITSSTRKYKTYVKYVTFFVDLAKCYRKQFKKLTMKVD